jgi:hypothetical protein
MIGATCVPRRRRRKWLARMARKLDPPQVANLRQQRYYNRRRNGMVCIRPQLDPTVAAECCARRDAQKLAQAKRAVEDMLERVRRAQSNSA